MLPIRTLHPQAAARSFSRIYTAYYLPVSHISTSALTRSDKMDDSLPSSGISTPVSGSVSGVSTPLRGQQGKVKGKGSGSAKPAIKKKEVKILMLHGYTQSGPLFRAKTRALEKLMAKALAPLNLVPNMIYPTAPNRLRPSDIPGFGPSSSNAQEPDDGQIITDAELAKEKEEEAIDSWAWFRKDDVGGGYRFFAEGMKSLAGDIRAALEPQGDVEGVKEVEGEKKEGEEEAVIDGVIGFSQGGAMAALLASAMESGRNVPTEHQEWVTKVREANKGQPLKFAVSYSGFFATPEDLGWLYEPKVRTPTLHFLGSLDVVVEENRVRGLIERCEDPHVVVHPGGHYVPISKEWVMPLVGFVRNCLEKKETKE
ncbi:serine hydrolase domain containing protein [Naviculisporaceae sp. PSN 640]